MRKTTEAASRRSKSPAGASERMRPSSLSGQETEASEGAADDLAVFLRYRNDPARFAREVLGSTWWAAQEEIARLLARHRRVAVKAANGVGKTYLAADIVLWFLYCHQPSIVLTTAPTWRQVESLLWQEIARRHRRANVLAESDPTRPSLPGALLQTRLKIAEGHFAMGLSTDEPVRFQGFHAENLLVVLDEACGVQEEIWEAVEGICVGRNNRALAISNPLSPAGRFYELFSSPRWKTVTISALAHPNVARGRKRGEPRQTIPGAVTRAAVHDRVQEWCQACDPPADTARDTFLWEGCRYRPNAQFKVRVLGEFPQSADDSLCSRDWIETAMANEATPSASDLCVLAVDVARFGSDETAFALRRGNCVLWLETRQGMDTVAVAEKAAEFALEERAQLVLVDEIGIGAGVVDILRAKGIAGLTPVNFAAKPYGEHNAGQYLNLRAQTYWMLRERLEKGAIRLPQDAKLATQLANLRYHFALSGQIQIESKDDIRRRGLSSPDRADAVAMLFGPFTEPLALALHGGVCAQETIRPVHWTDVAVW